MLRRIVKVSKKTEGKTLKKEVSQNEKKSVLKKRSNASEYLGGERKRFIHEKNVLENLVFGGEEELTKSLSNVTSQNRVMREISPSHTYTPFIPLHNSLNPWHKMLKLASVLSLFGHSYSN